MNLWPGIAFAAWSMEATLRVGMGEGVRDVAGEQGRSWLAPRRQIEERLGSLAG